MIKIQEESCVCVKDPMGKRKKRGAKGIALSARRVRDEHMIMREFQRSAVLARTTHCPGCVADGGPTPEARVARYRRLFDKKNTKLPPEQRLKWLDLDAEGRAPPSVVLCDDHRATGEEALPTVLRKALAAHGTRPTLGLRKAPPPLDKAAALEVAVQDDGAPQADDAYGRLEHVGDAVETLFTSVFNGYGRSRAA